MNPQEMRKKVLCIPLPLWELARWFKTKVSKS